MTRPTALFALLVFGSVQAQTARSSVFTDLKTCVPMPALEQPRSPGWTCSGVGGYTLRVTRDDDTRRSLRVDRWGWGSSFVTEVGANHVALKLEWRLDAGVPVALIVRLPNRYQIVGLGAFKTCLWAAVSVFTPQAHARALALADQGCKETK